MIEAVVTAYDDAGVQVPSDIRVLESGPTFSAALAQAAHRSRQSEQDDTAP